MLGSCLVSMWFMLGPLLEHVWFMSALMLGMLGCLFGLCLVCCCFIFGLQSVNVLLNCWFICGSWLGLFRVGLDWIQCLVCCFGLF